MLETIDLPSVRAEGYVFQIEVTYRAILAGFTVREVPIVFSDRTVGIEQDVDADRARGDVAGASAPPQREDRGRRPRPRSAPSGRGASDRRLSGYDAAA